LNRSLTGRNSLFPFFFALHHIPFGPETGYVHVIIRNHAASWHAAHCGDEHGLLRGPHTFKTILIVLLPRRAWLGEKYPEPPHPLRTSNKETSRLVKELTTIRHLHYSGETTRVGHLRQEKPANTSARKRFSWSLLEIEPSFAFTASIGVQMLGQEMPLWFLALTCHEMRI
jgi:hypothetical protein